LSKALSLSYNASHKRISVLLLCDLKYRELKNNFRAEENIIQIKAILSNNSMNNTRIKFSFVFSEQKSYIHLSA
jgi:hypothetical protein